MTRRADSRPAPYERQILERVGGVDRPAAVPSPRYALAASVRALNARLAQLSPERQAQLQEDWHDDWAALEADRSAAADDDAELVFIDKWAAAWKRRLLDG